MSQANYIIICKGRTGALTAISVPQKIYHASATAAELVSHIDVMHPGELTYADTHPISELQHYMMDRLDSMTRREAEAKIAEMFRLLDALEKKFREAGPEAPAAGGDADAGAGPSPTIGPGG